jgi:hypothetical protein
LFVLHGLSCQIVCRTGLSGRFPKARSCAAWPGTLWLGNAAYLYLSVSFIQMLKALMPVAVFGTGCALGLETFSSGALANMARSFLTYVFAASLIRHTSHGHLAGMLAHPSKQSSTVAAWKHRRCLRWEACMHIEALQGG